MDLAEDSALIAFAAEALLAVKAPVLLQFLDAAEENCESEDSRQLIEIFRYYIEKEPEDVERECIRLFGGATSPVCPPWQSAYVDHPHSAETVYASALEWYERAGFGSKTESQPADHAALLLKIYSRLLQSRAEDSVIESFCGEHLLWIPRFCASMRSNAQNDFYRALAVWLAAEIRARPSAAK